MRPHRYGWMLLLAAGWAHAECRKQRMAVLPLTLWDQKLYVSATVNGTKLRFFLDTGSAVTTLSQAAAEMLNLPRDFDRSADMLGVGGVESRLTLVGPATFGLGGLSWTLPAVPVAAFAARLADGTQVGGLIGADVLSRYDLDLDIPGRQLGLWQVTGCDTVTPDWPGEAGSARLDEAGSASLDVDTSRHATVPVRVDDVAVQLMLDTGSPGLMLSTRAAARAGAPPELLEESRRLSGTGINDRAFSAWLHIFARLEVAGVRFGDVRAVVVSPGRLGRGDGLLGLDYLKRGRVWLSYSTGRIFMQAPAG